MDRRAFIFGGTLSLLAAPFAAGAQQALKPTRIAFVCGSRCEGGAGLGAHWGRSWAAWARRSAST